MHHEIYNKLEIKNEHTRIFRWNYDLISQYEIKFQFITTSFLTLNEKNVNIY